MTKIEKKINIKLQCTCNILIVFVNFHLFMKASILIVSVMEKNTQK